jgi:glutamate-ammonia-ligase adenylyltransferase
MTLSDKLEVLVSSFPVFLQAQIKNSLKALMEYFETSGCCFNQNDYSSVLPGTNAFLEDILKSWARSDFIRENSVRAPELILRWSQEDSPLYRQHNELYYFQRLKREVLALDDETALMKVLRDYRREEMMRLMARDILQLADLKETLADVSVLADASVTVTLNYLYDLLVEKYGRPMSRPKDDRPAEQQYMLIMAMGKHGAKELNVSSDIDLIFAYPETGETDHPNKPIENQMFFTRLGQKLIHTLDHINADGFVFRVDMRLRPYGDSGALALNFSAFEDYYYTQGREWERYAMIKARIVNEHEHPEQSAKLMKLIQPFVYRKYADFSSIQALRDMKRLIMSEVHRKGGNQNIKLGKGGIREIEFIAQACQLIYGGRDISLQQTGLMPIYQILKEKEYLPAEWVDKLISSYIFLRNLEHAIQSLADKQTQLIPVTEEERDRVSWSMGFESWDQLEPVLSNHRNTVNQFFEDFLADPDADSEVNAELDGPDIRSLWQSQAGSGEWIEALKMLNFEQPESSFNELMSLKEHRLFALMSLEARQRFETFLPVLLQFISQTKSPSKALERVLGLVRKIMGRTVYFVLLYENLGALKQLCFLCSESPWISEHIAKSPIILDELLDPRTLFQPPNKAELEDELRQQLLRIPEDDLEAQMNCLRTFKQSHMLRVAASEIGGHLPLMKVSDYLTWLAESILAQAVSIAWRNLVLKHGLPASVLCAENADGDAGSGMVGQGFAIIGYGKLGGIELSYGSDLDMVFLYDADDYGMTQGERSINNQTFYMRLGQRIIHILSAQTTQGTLYETDMRLRPSGNSGMLVASIAAFEKYQHQDAWTWEHQALVRARAIVGDPNLVAKFDDVRISILTKPRDKEALRQEVVSMREKMKLNAKELDIKQGNGGLIDIEFISQYGVLAYSCSHPLLHKWTDNIRILESLSAEKCFADIDLKPLESAYRELRSALHRNSLADAEDKAEIEEFLEITSIVESTWQKIFN